MEFLQVELNAANAAVEAAGKQAVGLRAAADAATSQSTHLKRQLDSLKQPSAPKDSPPEVYPRISP